ncbi:MAG: hypothetical protein Kow0090_07660 [Myxococcota bacterium]
MKFNCDKCGAEYIIPDEKLGKKGVRVRCKRCQNIIAVRREQKEIQSVPSFQKVPSYEDLKAKDSPPKPSLSAPPPSEDDKPPIEEESKEQTGFQDEPTRGKHPISSSFEDQLEELGTDLSDISDSDYGGPPPVENDEEGVEDIPLPNEKSGRKTDEVDDDSTRVVQRREEPGGAIEQFLSEDEGKFEERGDDADLPLPPPPPEDDEFDAQVEKALSKLEEPAKKPKSAPAASAELEAQETYIITGSKEAIEQIERAKKKPLKKEREWFLALEEQPTGPVYLKDVEELWRRGELSPETLVWTSGYGDWIPLAQSEELKPLMAIEQNRSFGLDDDLLPLPDEMPAPPLPGEEEKKDAEEKTWRPSAGKALETLVGGELASLDEIEAEEKAKQEVKEEEEFGLLPKTDGESKKVFIEDLDSAEPTGLEELPVKGSPTSRNLQPYSDDKTVLRAPSPAPAPLQKPLGPPTQELPKTAYYEPSLLRKTPPSRLPSSQIYLYIGGGALIFFVLILVAILVMSRGREEKAEVAATEIAPKSFEARSEPQSPKEVKDGELPPKEEAQTEKAVAGTETEAEKTPEVAKDAEKKPDDLKPPDKKESKTANVSKAERKEKKRKPRSDPSKEDRIAERKKKKEEMARSEPPPPKSDDARKAKAPSSSEGDDLLAFESTSKKGEVDRILSAISTSEEEQKKAEREKKNKPPPPPPPPPPREERKLSKEQVQAVIKSNYSQIKACIAEQKRREPMLEGTMKVKWLIMPDGSTKSPVTENSTFARSFASGCITSAVSKWKFPAFDGKPLPVTYPFQIK